MLQELNIAGTERIRFVSDIHLGHAHALVQNPRQLAFLLQDCSHLVVCGDLSESRQGPFFHAATQQRQAFLDMCRQAGVTPILLAGNHDPNEQTSILLCQHGKLCALHGHVLFREVAPWGREYLQNKQAAKALIARFPEAEHNLQQRLQLAREMSLFVPPVYSPAQHSRNKWVQFFFHAAWPPERPLQILRSWLTMHTRMQNFATRFFPHTKVFIAGHLHRKSLCRHRNGCIFINLGACFHHSRAWAAELDPNGALSLRNYSPSGFVGQPKIIQHSWK